MSKETQYITIKDASIILGVSKLTLRNWDKSGKLKAHRHPFNNYRVYKLSEIENVIELIDRTPIITKNKKSAVRKLAVHHLEEDQNSVNIKEESVEN